MPPACRDVTDPYCKHNAHLQLFITDGHNLILEFRVRPTASWLKIKVGAHLSEEHCR